MAENTPVEDPDRARGMELEADEITGSESELSFGSEDELEGDLEFEGDDENEEEMLENENGEGTSTTPKKGKGKGKSSKTKGQKRKRKNVDPTKRRRIRRIFTESELDKETLNAQMEEKERLRRLELQKSLAAESPASKSAIPLSKSISPDTVAGNAARALSPVVVDLRQKNIEQQSRVIVIDSDDDDNDDTNQTQTVNCGQVFDKAIKSVEIISSGSDSDYDYSDSDFTDDDSIDETNTGMHSEDVYNKPDDLGRVLVNTNHPLAEEDIFLAPQIARVVKPHQIGGIRFLFDNLVETLARFKSSLGFGCILAHCMGLGKTLQVIAFIDIFLHHTSAKKVLCIVPINTIQNWLNEFNTWLPEEPVTIESEGSNKGASPQSQEMRYRKFKVFLLGDNQKTTIARAKVIGEWNKEGGVLLMGYELYRILALSTPCMASNKCAPPKKKRSSNQASTSANQEPEVIDIEEEEKHMDFLIGIQKALCKPGPDLVICDEGHRIKNNQANTSHALKKIRTRRRVVLTGYPLQNNLMEYWCMVDFVRPNFLGTKHEFANMFERPILNGQCCDSTPSDVRLMRFRAHVLHSLLEGFVQRRSQAVLKQVLPAKNEHIVLVNMSPIQTQLYQAYIDFLLKSAGHLNPIKGFHTCMKIWNHPDIFYSSLEGKLEGKRNESPLTLLDNDDSNGLLPTNSVTPSSQSSDTGSIFSSIEWAKTIMKDYKPFILEQGGKMVLLFEMIEESLKSGEKILLFSQSLTTLSVIEDFLGQRVIPFFPGRDNSTPTKWAKNKSYFRLDGSTSAQERERLIVAFNDESNKDVLLFMLSTRAGCLGVNLVGASRVIVFDSSWNPCHDVQAVCRVYRYGQDRPCHIYRLIATGTMEKKIYDRQVSKQGVANRVVDELNPEANFTKQEIMSLICEKETPVSSEDVATASTTFSDPVLARICNTCSEWIAKVPFKHESLLVNKSELKLTKEEKREAKRGYELEKRKANQAGRYCPVPAPQGQNLARLPPVATSGVIRKPVVTVNPVQTSQNKPIMVQPLPQQPLVQQLPPGYPWASLFQDAVQFASLNPNMVSNPINITSGLPYALIQNRGPVTTNHAALATHQASMATNVPSYQPNMAAPAPITMATNMPVYMAPLGGNHVQIPMAVPGNLGGATLPVCPVGGGAPPMLPVNLPMPAINQACVSLTNLTTSVSALPSLTSLRRTTKEVVTIDLDDIPSPPHDKLGSTDHYGNSSCSAQEASYSIRKDTCSSSEIINTSKEGGTEDLEDGISTAVPGSASTSSVLEYMLNSGGQTSAADPPRTEDTPPVTSAGASASQGGATSATNASLTNAELQNLLNSRGGLSARGVLPNASQERDAEAQNENNEEQENVNEATSAFETGNKQG